jgi:hypothetical protein
MSTLERHCQLLLRAYAAAYRDVRGEEIVGTYWRQRRQKDRGRGRETSED